MIIAVIAAILFFGVGLALLMHHEAAVSGRVETEASWLKGRTSVAGRRSGAARKRPSARRRDSDMPPVGSF